MKMIRIFVLLLTATTVFGQWAVPRIPLMDLDPLPEGYPEENPFSTMALWVSFVNPILNHEGKPHAHGNLFQVIVDGGNGIQDEPNLDGSPGGDDSLAYGNFNLFRMNGLDDPALAGKDLGLFYSHKYFVPYMMGRGYYLRLWEGKDAKIAPYYQDSKEYKSDTDAGGAFYFFKDFATPVDVEWKFSVSKPRPTKKPTTDR